MSSWWRDFRAEVRARDAARSAFAAPDCPALQSAGALREAAGFPLTIANLTGRAGDVWRHIGNGEFTPALSLLRTLDEDLRAITDRADGS
jgi:hypothetical protein